MATTEPMATTVPDTTTASMATTVPDTTTEPMATTVPIDTTEPMATTEPADTTATNSGAFSVTGAIVTDAPQFTVVSWWAKIKISISSPNPSGEVTVTVRTAGAELGGIINTPPEQEGQPLMIVGRVDANGTFSSSTNADGLVGSLVSQSIGIYPGLPGTSHVNSVIELDAIIKGSDSVVMSGHIWIDRPSLLGVRVLSAKLPWKVEVKKDNLP